MFDLDLLQLTAAQPEMLLDSENLGRRMLGTSGAFVTTSLVVPMLGGNGCSDRGHGNVRTRLVLSFLLPEPKAEKHGE